MRGLRVVDSLDGWNLKASFFFSDRLTLVFLLNFFGGGDESC